MRLIMLMFPVVSVMLITNLYNRQEMIHHQHGRRKTDFELYGWSPGRPIFKQHKKYLGILLQTSNANNIITFGRPAKFNVKKMLNRGRSLSKGNAKLGPMDLVLRVFVPPSPFRSALPRALSSLNWPQLIIFCSGVSGNSSSQNILL
jgi:hypothetical protein